MTVLLMDYTDRVSYLVAALGAQTRTRFASLLCPLGIAPQHFGVLRWIRVNDGSTQQEVAELMEVSRNVMVGLIDDLESAKLVVRGRHPLDRRAHALHLTAAGKRVLSQADHAADLLDEEILAPLQSAARAEFHAALQAIGASRCLSPGVFPENR